MSDEIQLSDCCNYTARVKGKTTYYYVCDKCQKACDLIQWKGKSLAEWNEFFSLGIDEDKEAQGE